MLFKVYQCGVDSYHGKEFCHELPHGFDCWSLIYAVTPQRMNRGDKLVDVPAGTCALYPPGYPRYLYCVGGADFFVNTWVHFSTDNRPAMDTMLVRCGIPVAELFRLPEDSPFQETMQEMVYEYSTVHANADEMISALMHVILIQIGRSIIPFDSHRDAADQRQRKLFEKLRKDIYSAPEKNWTGERMAADVFLSVNQLISLYKRFFGVTPKQDLLDARIVKAKTLMGSPSVIVKEVANNCGFENEYYFSRVFKQKTGMTPSEFSQQRYAAIMAEPPRSPEQQSQQA
ncbi:MAG: helix-turn-helix transcriptional regulator [Aristaeellaceae bacterium]